MGRSLYDTTAGKLLSDGDLISPFAAALLQRGRYLRNRYQCPHCKASLLGEDVIDLGHRGIYCPRCIGRRKGAQDGNRDSNDQCQS